ncbi:MAG TPA: metallophosphoesterase family protein [Hyphomicrobiales bacterium]|nr:metallophosphoesterase family protein [Hyphomicrobiales bacterium]
MTVFFTSDSHFGDAARIRVDRRPFPDIAAHDAALVANWNDAVGPGDEVWHLGDFGQRLGAERVARLLAGLHGTKHLVTGNNDDGATRAAAGWASVSAYEEITVDGRALVLCHYPFRTWNNMGKGVIDLHGHSHGRLTPIPRQYDVGVDVWDFRPVTLATILARRRRAARKG